MAVSMVGGWESGLELVGSPLVLINAWISFRTSFSWVGNNPSLQTHLLCENQRKCHHTCNSTEGLFSAVLMRHDLHVADPSYLPWNEAYELSHLFCYWCLAGKACPMGDTFPQKKISNTDSVQNFVSNLHHTCRLMLTPPVSAQSAIKKKLKPNERAWSLLF
jgi:hypothetical protein